MCKRGTTKTIRPIFHNETFGNEVDACLASTLQYVNDLGVVTIASCCGHNGEGVPYLLARTGQAKIKWLLTVPSKLENLDFESLSQRKRQ
jgi:hypothetical protein